MTFNLPKSLSMRNQPSVFGFKCLVNPKRVTSGWFKCGSVGKQDSCSCCSHTQPCLCKYDSTGRCVSCCHCDDNHSLHAACVVRKMWMCIMTSPVFFSLLFLCYFTCLQTLFCGLTTLFSVKVILISFFMKWLCFMVELNRLTHCTCQVHTCCFFLGLMARMDGIQTVH